MNNGSAMRAAHPANRGSGGLPAASPQQQPHAEQPAGNVQPAGQDALLMFARGDLEGVIGELTELVQSTDDGRTGQNYFMLGEARRLNGDARRVDGRFPRNSRNSRRRPRSSKPISVSH